MDCVSKDASSQPLDEAPVTDKATDLNESDCRDGKKLVDTNVAQNSTDQILDAVTISDEEPQSFKTYRFTRTISPPTLGTLRSCFSWSGSLRDFSRTPSPTPCTALQQFHREGGSPTSMPENKTFDGSQDRSDESGLLHQVGGSSPSQENAESPSCNLNASELSQPCGKACNSEVSHIMNPSFSNSYMKESRVLFT